MFGKTERFSRRRFLKIAALSSAFSLMRCLQAFSESEFARYLRIHFDFTGHSLWFDASQVQEAWQELEQQQGELVLQAIHAFTALRFIRADDLPYLAVFNRHGGSEWLQEHWSRFRQQLTAQKFLGYLNGLELPMRWRGSKKSRIIPQPKPWAVMPKELTTRLQRLNLNFSYADLMEVLPHRLINPTDIQAMEDNMPSTVFLQEYARRYGSVRLNDSYSLYVLEKNPSLWRRLEHRRELELSLQEIYKRPGQVQRFFTPTENLFLIVNGIARFSERPSPRQLDSLALLTIALLDEWLITNSANLASVILTDFTDRFTEYGGLVVYEQGQIIFREISSLDRTSREGNTSYRAPFSLLFYPGISAFHLHAVTADNSAFAGPSTSDVILSYFSRRPEIVITLLGPSTNGVLVNFDVYRAPRDEQVGFIVDLGSFELALPDELAEFKGGKDP